MGGRPEPWAPRHSRPSSSSFGWFSQPSRLPSRRLGKGILTVACGSYTQACHPGRPLSLHRLPLQALLHVLFLIRRWASLPAQSSSTLFSAAGPSTHPAGLSLNPSAPPPAPPHATLGCLPCSDSTMSRPAAISRPTSQLQVFVGPTGGLLVCLICSMPSPPAPPIFSSVRAEVVSTLSVHSPRPRQSGRVRNRRQKPPRMTFQKQTGVPPEARPQQGRTRGWGQVY